MPPTTKTRRPSQPSRPGPRRPPLIFAVLGIIALLAVIAIVASRNTDDDGATAGLQQTRPVVLTGEPLPPYVAGDDPAVGLAAPELAGAAFDGTPRRIADDGRPKVLLFLAHWCPHCQREVPVLADWLARNGAPEGVDVYAIATSTSPDRPNWPPSSWLDREQFDVPTLADDAEGSAAQAFGLSAFPFFVALDRDNHVVVRASGELSIEQWEQLLDAARS